MSHVLQNRNEVLFTKRMSVPQRHFANRITLVIITITPFQGRLYRCSIKLI